VQPSASPCPSLGFTLPGAEWEKHNFSGFFQFRHFLSPQVVLDYRSLILPLFILQTAARNWDRCPCNAFFSPGFLREHRRSSGSSGKDHLTPKGQFHISSVERLLTHEGSPSLIYLCFLAIFRTGSPRTTCRRLIFAIHTSLSLLISVFLFCETGT
jgi:hypothetical protein